VVHVLAKPNDLLLVEPIETSQFGNWFIKELVETNHFGNMFIKEPVETHIKGMIVNKPIKKITNCDLSN
jgi:hypothetical protein